jgi:hypothetical protein
MPIVNVASATVSTGSCSLVALACEAIDVRSLQSASAIRREIAVPEVVCANQDDIGTFLGERRPDCQRDRKCQQHCFSLA